MAYSSKCAINSKLTLYKQVRIYIYWYYQCIYRLYSILLCNII